LTFSCWGLWVKVNIGRTGIWIPHKREKANIIEQERNCWKLLIGGLRDFEISSGATLRQIPKSQNPKSKNILQL